MLFDGKISGLVCPYAIFLDDTEWKQSFVISRFLYLYSPAVGGTLILHSGRGIQHACKNIFTTLRRNRVMA